MKTSFFFKTALILLLLSSPALGGNYDIKEMTPEINRAIEARQARYSQLQDLKSGGILGEDNQGFIQVLRPLPEADSLADAENADRRVIYSAIVSQNNLGPDGMPQVKKVFAEVQRDKARSGDQVQLPSGVWTTK